MITTKNCPVHPRLKPLYDYLVYNKRLVDIEDYNEEVIDIYSKDVLDLIKHGHTGWENMVPAYVDTIIKDNKLFGFDPERKPNPDYTPPSKVTVQRVNPH